MNSNKHNLITLLEKLSPKIRGVYNYANIAEQSLKKFELSKKTNSSYSIKNTSTKIVNAFYSKSTNAYIHLDGAGAKDLDELLERELFKLGSSTNVCHTDKHFSVRSRTVIETFLNSPSRNLYKDILDKSNISKDFAIHVSQNLFNRCLEISLYKLKKEMHSNIDQYDLETDLSTIDFRAFVKKLGVSVLNVMTTRIFNASSFKQNIISFLEMINLSPKEMDNFFNVQFINGFNLIFELKTDHLSAEIKKLLLTLTWNALIQLCEEEPDTDFVKSITKMLDERFNIKSLILHKQKVQNQLEDFCIAIGDILTALYIDAKLLAVYTTNKAPNKKAPLRLTLVNKNLIFPLKTSLPKLTVYKNTKERDVFLEIDEHNVTINMFRDYRPIHNTYYLQSKVLARSHLEKHMEQALFTLNFNVLFEFFTVLDECLSSHIEHIIENKSLLTFLSHIYEIDFWTLKSKNQFPLKTFKFIIQYACDFTDIGKMRVNLSEFSNNSLIIKNLANKLFSTKIVLNEIFGQVYLMSFFDHFNYFVPQDGRGRVMLLSSALNMQLFPIVRAFISFYNAPTTSEIIKELPSETHEGFFKNLNEHLTAQIAAIFPIDLTYTKPSLKSVLDFDIKLGEAFHFWAFIDDFYNYKHDPMNYRCSSTYSLDSCCSGAQHLGLLMRSRQICAFGQLITTTPPTKDLYRAFIDFLNKDFYYAQHICRKLAAHNKLLYEALKGIWANLPKATIIDKPLSEIKRAEYLENAVNYLYTNDEFVTDVLNLSSILEDFAYYISTSGLRVLNAKSVQSKMTHNFKQWMFIRTSLVAIELIKLTKNLIVLQHTRIWEVIQSRRLYKQMIMTEPYGSVPFGHRKQLYTALLKCCLNSGIFISDKEILYFRTLSTFILKSMNKWLNDSLPKFKHFSVTTQKFIKLQNWKQYTFETNYFRFHFYPYLSKNERLNLPATKKGRGTRDGRLIFKKITDQLDWVKLGMTIPANIVQALDAALVYTYFIQLSQLPISHTVYTYTVHDRFFVPAIYAPFLKKVLKESYNKLLREDFFKKNFETAFSEFYSEVRTPE
jgi:hypothetical protein